MVSLYETRNDSKLEKLLVLTSTTFGLGRVPRLNNHVRASNNGKEAKVRKKTLSGYRPSKEASTSYGGIREFFDP